MKILHTADWHVGRTIRSRSRAQEHRDVLAEITQIASDHAVDAVIVAGDQFDVQAPTPESEKIVWTALQSLAQIAPVITVAGNHDNPRRLEAVRQLLAANEIHALGTPRRASEGGVVTITAADGTEAHIALLPFVHQRDAVSSQDLLNPEIGDGEYGANYAERYRNLASALTSSLPDTGTVNILVGHVTCFGGTRGGGEREAHTIERYCVDARGFTSNLDYVALGHLHNSQQVDTAPPVHYSGAPLQLDFGETQNRCSVNIVELTPGRPAAVETVDLLAGRRLVTLHGTYEEIIAAAVPEDDPWLRVLVHGTVPAGVADNVRNHLGEGVVDVRIDTQRGVDTSEIGEPQDIERVDAAPQKLFAQYMIETGVDDERIATLFTQLLDDELARMGTGAEEHITEIPPAPEGVNSDETPNLDH